MEEGEWGKERPRKPYQRDPMRDLETDRRGSTH